MKVKRFLSVVSFSAFISLYVRIAMPKNIFNVSLALFVVLIIIHRATVNKYTCEMVLSFIAVLIASSYLNIYNLHLSNQISKFDGLGDSVRTGVVVSKNHQSTPIRYTINLKSINGKKLKNFSVYINTDDILRVGENVKLTGKYKRFKPNTNKLHYYSKSIFGEFLCDKIEIINLKTNLNKTINEIKYLLLSKIREVYNFDNVPIVAAMGLGDKNLLNSNIVNQFNFAGISHTLVVSGLHVGIIVMAVSWLLFGLPIKKVYKNIVTSLVVFLFMLIVGFTPSVIRAGILSISILLSRSFILEIDNFTILAIIIFITLMINPYSAANISMLLSYCAYFGVIYRAEISNKKGYRHIATTLLMSFMAVVFTSPVMSMLGMNITLLAPIFNLIAAPIIFLVCVLSFFTPLLSFIPGIDILNKIIFVPLNEFCISILLNFTEYISNNFQFAMIDIGKENIKFIIWTFVICCGIAYVQFSNKKISRFFVISVSLVSLLCYNYMNKDTVIVSAFPNGGEPSFEISYNGDNYLVLSGNMNEKRLSYLGQNNFLQTILCCEKEQDLACISQYSDEVIILNSTDIFVNDILKLKSDISDNSRKYTIDVDGVKISFSYGDAEIGDSDFYFMGSDRPIKIESKNNYYFYNSYDDTKTSEYLDMTELYNVFTIKIKNGRYRIIKDVKNFGYKL